MDRRTFLGAVGVGAAGGLLGSSTGATASAATGTNGWSGYRGGPHHSGAAAVDGIGSVERTRWSAGSEDTPATMPAVVDGTAYFAVGARAMAVDVQSGVGEWVADVPAQVTVTPAVSDDSVFVTTAEGDVVALDREGGEERWSVGIGGTAGGPAVADGSLYVGNHQGRIVAFDAASGDVQWSIRRDDVDAPEYDGYRPTVGNTIRRPTPTVSGDSLYVNLSENSGPGKLAALDRSDGSEKWSVQFEAESVYPPAVAGDLLAVSSDWGDLKVLSKAGGLVQWKQKFDNEVRSPPAFDGTTVALVVGTVSNSTACYAFDASSGSQRWTYEYGSRGAPGGVALADGTVYAVGTSSDGTFDEICAALDADSGLEQFTVDLETETVTAKTPTPVENGVVIPDGPKVRCLGSEPASESTTTATDAPDGSTGGDGSTGDDTGDTATTASGSSGSGGQTAVDTRGNGSNARNFISGGGLLSGDRTLSVVSIVVTVIGTFVGLLQLLRGD